MFYGNTIQDTRQLFYISWSKYQRKQLLEPLEQQIVDVILAHPEYQSFFANATSNEMIFSGGENNPFLHLGLHLAIRDQVKTDRPTGISEIYQKLLLIHGDHLIVEHCMMECLADFLWRAQNSPSPLAEKEYLAALSSLFTC